MEATLGSLSDTATLTVDPASADHLVVSSGTSQVAGTAFSVTVTAKDAYGNIATGYTGTVTFSSSDSGSSVSLPADYTFTAGDAGTYTFTNGVTLVTVGTQWITATDTVTGSIAGSQTGITVNAAGLHSITVGVSSPTVVAGNAETLSAEGYDQYGNDLGPQSVTFTVNDAPVSGSSVTENLVGDYTVSVTATGVSITTASFHVNADALDHITIGPATASITAGGSQPYSAEAFDQYNNDLGDVTASAVFSVNGVPVTGNSVSATLVGSYTVTATYNGKSDSTTLTVTAAAAKQLVVSGFPSSVTAGTAGSVTVTAKDQYGNVATGYTGTVQFTSSDDAAVLPTNYVFTTGSGKDNGIHTFASVTLKTAGTQSITAGDGSLSASQTGIVVNAGALDHFTITGYPTTVTDGQSFGGVKVTAYDAYGNVKTDYTGSVYFTSTDGAAVLPYTSGSMYTFTSGTGMDNGVHTFLGFTLNTVGSRTITVTDGSKFATTNPITVVASGNPHYSTSMTPTSTPVSTSTSYTYTITRNSGSGTHLGWVTIQVPAGFTGISVTSVTSGSRTWVYSVSSNTITVHAQSSGDELTSSGQTVTVVFSATAPSSPGTYGPLVSTVYSNYQGTGSPGTLDGSDPTVLVYVPGVLDHFTITGYPSSRTAGQNFGSNTVVVRAYDGGNNILTGYTGQVYFISTDGQAVLPYTSGSKYPFVSGDAGQHTFAGTDFTLKTAGTQTITVTDGSISTTSNSITVNSAAAYKLVYTTGLDQTLPRNSYSAAITVQRRDQYDNPVTGSITITLSGAATGSFYSMDDNGNYHLLSSGTITIPSDRSSVAFYYRDTAVGTPTIRAQSDTLDATTTITITNLVIGNIASQFTPTNSITPGSQVKDTAKLVTATGTTPTTAGGTFTYYLYRGTYQYGTPTLIDSYTVTVTNGIVPDSKQFTVPAADSYFFLTKYSGDTNNAPVNGNPEEFIAWIPLTNFSPPTKRRHQRQRPKSQRSRITQRMRQPSYPRWRHNIRQQHIDQLLDRRRLRPCQPNTRRHSKLHHHKRSCKNAGSWRQHAAFIYNKRTRVRWLRQPRT